MAQVSAETALPTDGEAGFPLTGRHHWPADGPLYRGGGEEAEAPRQLIARVADVVQHDCHTASHVPRQLSLHRPPTAQPLPRNLFFGLIPDGHCQTEDHGADNAKNGALQYLTENHQQLLSGRVGCLHHGCSVETVTLRMGRASVWR